MSILSCQKRFNTFLVNDSILYPLKNQKNFWFCCVFREYKMEILTRYELTDSEI